MSPLSGLRRALGDLAGAFVPLSVRELEKTLQDRVRKIPARLNEYGFDPWGLHPETVRSGLLTTLLLYKYYFRVETSGIENVPPGGVLLISNHAGQLPFDGMMISTAMLMEADPPRMVRGMAEYFVGRTPWVSVLASRGGGVAGTPHTCAEMLAAGEAVMAFPEGARGMNKLYRDRYRLERFGHGFMRLALEADVPIVPISVVGSEDQNPGLANLGPLARALDLPAFPITPTFPLLGPLGMLPMPVKYRIYFHEPIHFGGAPTDEDAVIDAKVERVKQVIEAGFERGLAERDGVFR